MKRFMRSICLCRFCQLSQMTVFAKGKDYNGGGARYNTKYMQGVGIGTITDCLAAVKYNVYDKKTFTMAELLKALDDNFEGHERIGTW